MNELVMEDLYPQRQDISQHWSYSSERYAGGDNLLTAIARGWDIDPLVTLRRHWFAGMRCIEVYHFTIRRAGIEADMAVLGNPYVTRFLASHAYELIEADATPSVPPSSRGEALIADSDIRACDMVLPGKTSPPPQPLPNFDMPL